MITIIKKRTAASYVFASLISISVISCGGSGSSPIEKQPEQTEPATDTVPNAFSFTNVSDAELSTEITSNEITISGINSAATISITVSTETTLYSINGSAFTGEEGTVNNGDKVNVKVRTSPNASTPIDATLTIGGVSSTFTVTTLASSGPVTPSGIQVDINFDTKHSVGGVETFDRQKFITIHSSPLGNDWGENNQFSQNASNADPDLMVNFMTDNDVFFGRDTGSIGWALRNLSEDSAKPGFIDEASIVSAAGDIKWSYGSSPAKKSTDARLPQIKARSLDMIEGGQQFPYWSEDADHSNINPYPAATAWKFSQTDTVDEPFGTATGHYFGQYLSNFFRDSDAEAWKPKPKYFEIMNEPLFELTSIRNVSDADYVTPQAVFDFHVTTAAEIRKVAKNSDIAVGGYTVAFPDFDKDNFQRWHDRDKLFMDTAAAEMDFYSIHLYDFPCIGNSEKYRSGSNMEATLDMMENYSRILLGEMKPYVISEYGAANHCERSLGWTNKKDTLVLQATNKMIMSFLERPDTIAKTIPFIVVKAEWGRTTQQGVSIPYGPRLMVQEFERSGISTETDWVYSDLVLFYNLWSEVNGTRVDTWSSDLDIQVDAYVEGSNAFIILNNLEFDEADINLNALGLDPQNITAVNIKHLRTDNWESKLDVTNPSTLPDSVTIDGEGTMIIKVTYNTDITIDKTNDEVKYYSSDFKQAITTNAEITFNINNVVVGANGEAILRLGIGRAHGKSLLPTVMVNGTAVTVPADFRGYDQVNGKVNPGRDNYFGVLEISVPLSDLQASNTITVEFGDTGGFVSTAALQVFTTSTELSRSK